MGGFVKNHGPVPNPGSISSEAFRDAPRMSPPWRERGTTGGFSQNRTPNALLAGPGVKRKWLKLLRHELRHGTHLDALAK
jgi:hypothetical protein